MQTVKGGRVRQHVIPEYLRYVLTWPSTPMNTQTLHKMFDDVMVAGVRHPEQGEGWHALRRSVVTALYRAELPEAMIHEWLGWRSAATISRRYYRPEPGEIDGKVFAKHPYVRLWATKGE